IDPESGQPFVYVGAGVNQAEIRPESVIAFSPTDTGAHRNVLMADGSVQQISSEKFADLTRRGYILPATPAEMAQNRQNAAVRQAQLPERQVIAANQAPQANAPATNAVAAAPPPKPSGVRSIRIDLPRAGELLVFTKVLNAGGEALTLRAKIMKSRTFQTARMALQLGGFCGGLLLCWWQWKRARRSFVLTLGLALALGSVADLLIAWRWLHTALILSAPILALTLLAWLVWRFWPRHASSAAPHTAALASGAADAGPALASIAILLFAYQAAAGEPEPKPVPAITNSPVSILAANYSGEVDDRVAHLEATIKVAAGQPGRKLLLFADDVAVKSIKPGDGRIEREGNSVVVLLPGRGTATLQLKLLVKLD